jgi:hypothetical protein
MPIIRGYRINFLKILFRVACFTATFGMSVFWCLKFVKDEDLCQIEYKSFKVANEIDHPMMSLCFIEPFIDSQLKVYNKTMTEKHYRDFLRGNDYYEGMEKVDFENVTIQITDFYIGDSITWKNGSYKEGRYPNFANKLPSVSYIGFWYDNFIKCFGLRLQDKDMKNGYFGFNSSVFPNNVRPSYYQSKENMKLIISFHLPDQMLLSENSIKYNWPKRTKTTEHTMEFELTHLEVVKRRNKRTESCVANFMNYDQDVLKKHIQGIGCRAPYQNQESNYPICSTKEKMKQTMVNLNSTENVFKILGAACTSIEDIRYTFDEIEVDWWGKDWFWISVTVPRKLKMIYQVRAVDAQTVIGNAGGYVGLFLGKQTCVAIYLFTLARIYLT